MRSHSSWENQPDLEEDRPDLSATGAGTGLGPPDLEAGSRRPPGTPLSPGTGTTLGSTSTQLCRFQGSVPLGVGLFALTASQVLPEMPALGVSQKAGLPTPVPTCPCRSPPVLAGPHPSPPAHRAVLCSARFLEAHERAV